MAWQVFWFCLLPSILLIRAFWLGVGRHSQVLPPLDKFHKETIEKWQRLGFVTLSNGVDLHDVVGGFPHRFDISLDDEQNAALTQSMVNLIEAFHKGTFDDYVRFRCPVKEFSFSVGVSNLLVKQIGVPKAIIEEKMPLTAFRSYWDIFVKHRYSNLWIGISVSNCEVHVTSSISPTNDLEYALKYSSALFKYDSIVNVELLAKTLKGASDSDKLSHFLLSRLSPATSNMVLAMQFKTESDFEETQKAVLDDLNRIIQSGSIYEDGRFQTAALHPDTLAMLHDNPTGEKLVTLNRLLLVDSYPYIFRRWTLVDNVGMTVPGSMIVVRPSRMEILESNGSLKVATITILPKLRDNYASVPVYLSLYWSPTDKKWIPEKVIVVSSRGSESGPQPVL
jgi:hypothetical protein